MKASLLKLQRRKVQPEGQPKANYRLAVFSVCLLISSAFWLMIMLSEKYTESLVFYIEYQHLPEPGIQLRVTDTLRLKVNATGYRIEGYKLGIYDKFVKIDASQFRHKENQYYYTMTNHLHSEKIEEQLGEEVKVVDISPDTLFIRPLDPQTPGKG